MERKPLAGGTGPAWRAAATMARARGCSLSASTAPARRSTSSSSSPTPATAVTACSPLVRVPVLSNSTASTVRMRSRAKRSLIRMPAWAATAVDSETTRGMARPRAWGQAMTSTVTVRTTASSSEPGRPPGYEGDHAGAGRDVEEQGREAVGQGLGPAPDAWASATSRWMPARAVSSPTASTRTRRAESVTTVPATTGSPRPWPPVGIRR